MKGRLVYGCERSFGPETNRAQLQFGGHMQANFRLRRPAVGRLDTAKVDSFSQRASNQAAIIIVTNPPSLVVVFETHSDLSY